MRKAMAMFIGYLAMLCGIAIANGYVLLQMHPQSYYYTIPGLLLSGAVSICEAVIILPISEAFLNGPLKRAFEEMRK